MDDNYLQELFIDEAAAALNRHNNLGIDDELDDIIDLQEKHIAGGGND